MKGDIQIMNIKKMKESRQAKIAEMDTLLKTVETETRALTALFLLF